MFLMAPPFVFLMYMIHRQPRLFFLDKGLNIEVQSSDSIDSKSF